MVPHGHFETESVSGEASGKAIDSVACRHSKTPPDMKSLCSLTVTLLLIVATLFNTGCAETRDGRKTQAQGTAIGAAGGAILGALVGVASGNRRNIGGYAAAGAVAGGAAGFVYGTAVAKRKARYARAEQWLNQEIVLARRANNRAYAYNSSLKSRLANLQSRAKAARTASNRAAVKSEIAQLQRGAAQQARTEAQTETDVKAVLGDSQARSADNYDSYQKEANAFHKAKSERGELLDRLASLDNSLDR